MVGHIVITKKIHKICMVINYTNYVIHYITLLWRGLCSCLLPRPIFFFWPVLELEPKDSHMLGQISASELHLQHIRWIFLKGYHQIIDFFSLIYPLYVCMCVSEGLYQGWVLICPFHRDFQRPYGML